MSHSIHPGRGFVFLSVLGHHLGLVFGTFLISLYPARALLLRMPAGALEPALIHGRADILKSVLWESPHQLSTQIQPFL